MMDEFNAVRLLSHFVKERISPKYCKLVPKTAPHGNVVVFTAVFIRMCAWNFKYWNTFVAVFE